MTRLPGGRHHPELLQSSHPLTRVTPSNTFSIPQALTVRIHPHQIPLGGHGITRRPVGDKSGTYRAPPGVLD